MPGRKLGYRDLQTIETHLENHPDLGTQSLILKSLKQHVTLEGELTRTTLRTALHEIGWSSRRGNLQLHEVAEQVDFLGGIVTALRDRIEALESRSTVNNGVFHTPQ
jgi:hypothetical protein